MVARGLFALAPTSVIPEKYNYVHSIIPSLAIGVKFSNYDSFQEQGHSATVRMVWMSAIVVSVILLGVIALAMLH